MKRPGESFINQENECKYEKHYKILLFGFNNGFCGL